MSVFFQVLNRCASANWSERKEGLLGLQALLKNQRTLRSATGCSDVLLRGSHPFSNQISNMLFLRSRVELKRLCEIFTRMFADPHSKVCACGTYPHGQTHTLMGIIISNRILFHQTTSLPLHQHPSLTVLDSAQERDRLSTL